MKKLIAIILVIITLIGGAVVPAYATDEYPRKRDDIFIRDPYVLTYDGKYYMYGTGLSRGNGYGCIVSENLEDWSESIQIFTPGKDFDGIKDFWAPECHYYNGKFYLFATYYSSVTSHRGVAIFVSDTPTGPFELLSDGHITPKDRDCIDGTLYVDDEGQPWMVYVNEWTSNEDGVGEMAIAKLSENLDSFISEPKMIFRAKDGLWTSGIVTDGPFMYRTQNGRLLMLWSNFTKRDGYAVGIAWSGNDEITGKWRHQPNALYRKSRVYEYSGGHGMIFKTLDGQLMLAIHSPNDSNEGRFARAVFIPVKDTGSTIVLADNYTPFNNFLYKFIELFDVLYFKIAEKLITGIVKS